MPASLSIRKGATRLQSAEAAAAALHAAIAQPDIKLAVFYCSPAYDLPELAKALRQHFGDIPLIGCTTAGEITPEGYLSGSLTGVSLAYDIMQVAITAIPLNPLDSQRTTDMAQQALSALQINGEPATAQNTFAFILIDGLSMQEELLSSCVHNALRGVELIGGSAADDVRFGSTWLYHQGEFRQHMALLALVQSDLPFLAFRTQHFVNSTTRMVVTRADPSRRVVYEINGLPAAPEFARMVGVPISELTPLVFATHPVVVRIGGQPFVRSIAKVNDDNSLTFFCAIDEGIVLTIAQGNDMVQNLADAFAEVREQIGEPQLILGCDCILRRLETERTQIKDKIGALFAANQVIGFATYGEQFNATHVNQTFTGLALGMKR